eukprot:scaffold29738_cov129-Isochrysis_galbana.AAC.6
MTATTAHAYQHDNVMSRDNACLRSAAGPLCGGGAGQPQQNPAGNLARRAGGEFDPRRRCYFREMIPELDHINWLVPSPASSGKNPAVMAHVLLVACHGLLLAQRAVVLPAPRMAPPIMQEGEQVGPVSLQQSEKMAPATLESARVAPVMDSAQGAPVRLEEVAQTIPTPNVRYPRPLDLPSYSGRVVPTKGRYGRSPVAEDLLVQGGSLRTWSYRNPNVDQVQVELSTEGRPLDADIELWHGPDNTPFKMRVYVENGQLRPFRTVIAAPKGPNTVALRNIGGMEFPFAAHVFHEGVDEPSDECISSFMTIQGGALRTYAFEPDVDSVQVSQPAPSPPKKHQGHPATRPGLCAHQATHSPTAQILINSDGRPLNARIELIQGPNNNKEVIELYAEDGFLRPFFCTLQTPGSGNVVRMLNLSPVEFPMFASIVALDFTDFSDEVMLGGDVVVGGDLSAV